MELRFYLLDNGKVRITDDSNTLHRFFLEKGVSDVNVRLDKNYRLEELVVTEKAKCNSPQARNMFSYTKADGVEVHLTSIYHKDQMSAGKRITTRPHPELCYAETFAIPINPRADYYPQYTFVQRVIPIKLDHNEYQIKVRRLLKFKEYDPRYTYLLWPQDKSSISVGSVDELSNVFERLKMKQRLKRCGSVELEDVGKKLLQQLVNCTF